MEYIYLNRDNKIELRLRENGALVDLSGVTRIQLTVGGVTLDSNLHPEYFSWDSSGNVIISAGKANLTPGTYDSKLIVYDSNNPDGLLWGKIKLVVE